VSGETLNTSQKDKRQKYKDKSIKTKSVERNIYNFLTIFLLHFIKFIVGLIRDIKQWVLKV
jgi:hypothetical protein